jgi:hypothetical protein
MNNTTFMYLMKMIFRPKDQLSRLTFGLPKVGMMGLVGGWGLILFSQTHSLRKILVSSRD